MYFDWAVAMATFLLWWGLLSWRTHLSDSSQFIILSAVTATAVVICYPWSRSLWTVLVYLCGGIQCPPLRVLPGGNHEPIRTSPRRVVKENARRARRHHRR